MVVGVSVRSAPLTDPKHAMLIGITRASAIGDTAHGTAPMLDWLVEQKQIEPHVPVRDKSERHDGTLSRADFTFDAKHDR
jgi:hypothetical protein